MYSLTDEQKQKQTKNLNVHCLKNLKANILPVSWKRKEISQICQQI